MCIVKLSVYGFLNVGILYSLTHGNYVYRQMHSVTRCSHLILDLCSRQSALNFPFLPGLNLSIVAECFPNYWSLTRFLTHLNPSAKKLGFGLSALVPRRRCWDYSLVRSPLGSVLYGLRLCKKGCCFLATECYTHTHEHTHTHGHMKSSTNDSEMLFFRMS